MDVVDETIAGIEAAERHLVAARSQWRQTIAEFLAARLALEQAGVMPVIPSRRVNSDDLTECLDALRGFRERLAGLKKREA